MVVLVTQMTKMSVTLLAGNTALALNLSQSQQ